MEALQALAGNGIWSLGTILVVIIILLFAVKKGWISFKGHGLSVGETDERKLITNQWTYSKALCDSMYNKIRPYCDNDYHALYLIASVEDIMQDMVVHNHISSDDVYIRCKQQLVYSAIIKRTSNEHFQTPEFRQCCDKFVRDLIIDLYNMKQIMS